jgi:hypothetical protein
MYIYRAIQRDTRWIPPRETEHEFPTEEETVKWLQEHGGGIYRNILHSFDCEIKPQPS